MARGCGGDAVQDLLAALGGLDRVGALAVLRPRAPAAPVETHVREYVSKVFTENWPFGQPYPAVHYDPRTVSPGSTASLHAKCIVVDARHTLITSANFTGRGQTRNVELGVLLDDPDFGARVVGQWRALANAGLLESVAPPGR